MAIWDVIQNIAGANTSENRRMLGSAVGGYFGSPGTFGTMAANPGQTAKAIGRGLGYFEGGPTDSVKQVGHAPKKSPSSARLTLEPETQENPLGDLYAELLANLREEIKPDLNNLMAQIQAQINPVFDTQRETIEMLMARQEEQGAAAQEEIRGMYNALAQDYEQRAPRAREQAQQGEQEVEQLYGQLKSNIEGNYSRIQQEQAEQFEKLGIESALPDVLAEQGELATEGMSQADELSAINQQRYKDMGQIDRSYYQQGGPLAKLQGQNVASDLEGDLQDYLFERGRDISQLEAQRTSDITGAFNQLAGQATSAANQTNATNQQQLFQMLAQMQEAQANQPEVAPAQQLLGQFQPPEQQGILNAFNAVMQGPDIRAGRMTDPNAQVPGTRVPITDQQIELRLRQYARRQGFDKAMESALVNYYRLYGGTDPSLLGLQ